MKHSISFQSMVMAATLLLSLTSANAQQIVPPQTLIAQAENFTPPAWEDADPYNYSWTIDAYTAIETYGTTMLQGSSDVGNFCPNYKNLEYADRVNFWAYLVSEVTRYESSFDPTNRYQESTMGIDPVTKKPVYSEGLLQLSYQDVLVYPFCEFNWAVDKKLAATDPNKTILNPTKNLFCGIRILELQIKKRGLIATNSGVYWSTLWPKSRYNKLAQIKRATRALPFCKL